jgi:SAM-dependent methyltransferase
LIPDPALNIWEHSASLRKLCYRRALDLEPEMDCAAQAAELVAPYLDRPALKLLDVGCGGGHFYHCLVRRGLLADYYGLDYSPSLVRLAKAAFKKQGLDPQKIILGDVRDLRDFACDIALVVNTLSFNPDFRAPLDRLSQTGCSVMVIRDNFGAKTLVRYEIDGFLDQGFNHLKGYWNCWSVSEVSNFLSDYSFKVKYFIDRRTQGKVELVVGKPYHWSWLVAERK